MRLLAVPNWSFGREKALLRQFREVLSHPAVELHYCEADVDHNRTVTAFSGEEDVVADMVFRLAISCFDSIDLNTHVGVHPRIGALDVCPLVLMDTDNFANPGLLMRALTVAENLAGRLAASFDLPIFLYEKSERGRHEADLSALRQGGFGAMLERPLKPDFGPSGAHPRLGVTVLGVRDPLVAFNINLETEDIEIAQTLARMIRQMRSEGDERVLGARVMALPLPSRKLTQLHINLTMPNTTPVDPIVEWAYEQVTNVKVKIAESELVGVIRNSDVPNASRLLIRPMQILGE